MIIQIPNESGGMFSCPDCGAEIVFSMRRKLDNPINCPECNEPLQVKSEESGEWLNLHWAPLDTDLSRMVGKLFNVARFPSEAISLRWHLFEKRNRSRHQDIENAARRLSEKNFPVGDRCFSQVISMIEKRHSPDEERRYAADRDIETVIGLDPRKKQ